MLTELAGYLPKLAEMIETSHEGQQLEWRLKYANIEAALALQSGDLAEARRICDWIIGNYEMEFDWHLGFALYTRGQINEREGQFEKAKTDYRSANRLDNQTYVVDYAAANIERLRNTRP